jgi:hypothetical protein
MRTYIKIQTEPKKDAIKALEKMAIDMPKVCIFNTVIAEAGPTLDAATIPQDENMFDIKEGPRVTSMH